jgi:hypothetical protein
LVNEFGSFGVNGTLALGVDGTTFIDGFTNDVDDTTENFLTNRNGNGSTSVNDLLATDETFENKVSKKHVKKKATSYECLTVPSVPSIAIVRTVFSPKC